MIYNSLFYRDKMRDLVITAVLGLIMVLNLADVVTDINLGVPTGHIVEESMIVLAAGITVTYLVIEMRRRTRELDTLSDTLNRANQQIASITDEMRSARRQYGETIRQQFEQWQLTASEQQVAMLLLKGLSFNEIAAVRNTREKTVRQQASTIYAKSGVDGRHAFAAWFLEDFIAEQPIPAAA
jgi:DNA-binding CsgD family transcriptional regulator